MARSRPAVNALSVALLFLSLTVVVSAQSIADLVQRAEKSDAKAMVDLGAHYAAGDGVPQDYMKAADWWRKGAEQGDADAEFALGALYESGNGVPQDYGKAAALYRKSAEQGHAAAEYSLGSLYYEGLGVPKDHAQAAVWYRKAAEQGDADAEFYLGLSYASGLGVPQDSAQAAFWYRKAADQNDAKAQHALGLLYSNGLGVPQDYVEAYFWLDLAAAGKTETVEQRDAATKARDLVAKILTPAKLSQIQERARKWFETHAEVSDGSDQTENPKQQADKGDASKQRAIEQLRAIAEAIKICPESDQTTSEFSMVEGRAKEGAFRRRVTAPLNVTWDLEQRPSSIRSPEIGFIEFTTNESCFPVPPTPTCNRNDKLCWVLFQSDSDTFKSRSEYCDNLKPNQYRYEFDFGPKGLEFARAMRKPENADKSLWAAIDLGGRKDWTDAVAASCVADAVRLSLTPRAPESFTTRPPEIPETLWEAANKRDAEYDLLAAERTLPGFQPMAAGRCDYACGLKPIPPIGCGPEAICACKNNMECSGCAWVFTNCH